MDLQELIPFIIVVIVAAAIQGAVRSAKKKAPPPQASAAQNARQDALRRQAQQKAVGHIPAQTVFADYAPQTATMRPHIAPAEHLQEHPAFQGTIRTEAMPPVSGSLGIDWAGEGCETPHDARPAWEDAPRGIIARQTLSRAELARGIVMAEVLGPRGGRARNPRMARR